MPWDGSLFGYAPSPVPQGGPVMPPPSPAPQPTPGATSPPPVGGVPTPGSGAGGQTPQQLAEFIAQLLHGGQGGANNPAPGSANGNSGMFGSVQNYIQMGMPAELALKLATMAPYGIGTLASVIQAGLHGANTLNSSGLQQKLGGPGLDFGQSVGGVLGFNRYGDFSDPLIMNRDTAQGVYSGASAGVSPGGVYDPSFLSRMFGGQLQTEYTPDEFADRRAMAGIAKMPQANAAVTTSPAWFLEARNIIPGSPEDPGRIGGAAGGAYNGNGGQFNSGADVGFGAGNYASSTGAPSGPAITSGRY